VEGVVSVGYVFFFLRDQTQALCCVGRRRELTWGCKGAKPDFVVHEIICGLADF
jgi:hypothetical protein